MSSLQQNLKKPLERKKGEKKLEFVHESMTATNKERRIQKCQQRKTKKTSAAKRKPTAADGRLREREREREKTRESVSSLLEKWDLQNKNCSNSKAA